MSSNAAASSSRSPLNQHMESTTDASEATPLIADQDHNEHDIEAQNGNETAADNTDTISSTQSVYPPTTFGLTLASLVLSIAIIVMFTVTQIFWSNAPSYYRRPYQVEDMLSVLFAGSVCALLLAIANFIRLRVTGLYIPLLINIIADAALTFYTLAAAIGGVNFWDYSEGGACYCGFYRDQECDKTELNVCDAYRRNIKTLLLIVFVAGLVLGLVHAVLFVLRCVAAYKTKFWRAAKFSVPAGQLSVEFSIKWLKPEDMARTQERRDGVGER